jgi:hypothetical protein
VASRPSASPIVTNATAISAPPRPLEQRCAHAGDHEDQHRRRQVDEPRLDRREIEDLLEVQRRVQEDREERGRDREHGDLRARELLVPEETEREHRLLDPGLDRQEAREQQHCAAELGHDLSAAPAHLVPAQEAEHEQKQAGDERRLAGPVDAAGVRVT